MTSSTPFRRIWLFLAGLLVPWVVGLSAPFVEGFTPDFGPPGTQVRIIGSGFRPTATPPIVQFGTAVASLLSASQTEIQAVVPIGATTAPITVTVPNGGGFYTTPFPFYVPPRIDDFGTEILGSTGGEIIFKKPVVATQGARLLIVGANFFVPNFPRLLVKVGSTTIPATATASSQIQATLPAILETGYVSVQTEVGATTNTTEYVYSPPRITNFTPRASVGDTIEINGLNFLTQTASQLDLRLGGVRATTVDVKSNTNLLVVVPANALTGPLTLTAPGGAFITTSNLTILPSIANFTPVGGPAGTVVTINGSGLNGTTQVRFGNALAAAVTNLSQLQVTAVVPANPLTAPITLITTNGTNVSADLFYAPPALDTFTPTQGGPGTAVTVNGSNFTGTTEVRLNGAPVPEFVVVSNTRITFAVPINATSGRLAVTTPGGTNQSTLNFTVRGPEPQITSFNPASGGVGTEVTIVGANLAGATAVAFNGVNATFQVVQETSLQATVPANATTGKIRVTTPNGVAESTGNFLVGATADVRILFGGAPNPAVAFAPLVYNIQAFNNGPLAAQNTVIEFTIPPGMALIETIGTLQPQVEGQKLTYNRGQLEVGGVFLAGVRVNAGAPGNGIAFGRILTSTPDTNTVNNELFTTNVVALPRLVIEDIGEDQVLLSWPSAAGTFYQLNSATRLEGPFDPVSGAAIDDGAHLQLAIPSTNLLQLFRLELLGQ